MNDDNTPPDFGAALAKEFGLEAETPPETTPPAPAPTDGEGGEGEEQPPQADPKGTVPPEDGGKPPEGEPAKPTEGEGAPNSEGKQETVEEKANREAEEAAAQEAKPLTAEDIQAAIRADREQTQGRVTKVHDARNQIIEHMYPEGIDKNIYDTDGKVIKTAQDIVDRGLINENTNEPFTYEEAASFVLEANRKMAENIEELNNYADSIAEKNISLMESNERVMGKYGEMLKAMPDIAKQLAETYITTQLTFDKTGNYITNMSMTPEQYYDLTLAPYRQLGTALAEKQQLEAAQQAQEQAAEQAERNGIPPQRGTSATKPNTGNAMLDALIEELGKE